MTKIRIGKIERAILHYIGRLSSNEGVRFSNTLTNVEAVSKELVKNIASSFNSNDLYKFDLESDSSVLFAIKQIFSDPNTFVKNSKLLAKSLYDCSSSTKVKSGNLWVIHLDNVQYDKKTTDAIAILKVESKEKRVIFTPTDDGYLIQELETYSLRKFDKGCIILNINSNQGYIVSQFVNGRSSFEERYWRDEFLHVNACQSSFQQTRALVRLCESFVKNQFKELDKKDKSLLYAKIKSSLKNIDDITIDNFAKAVFDNESARNFVSYYKAQGGSLQLPEHITVDSKKIQTKKVFPIQTIHLDSNFDISIYGGEGYLMKDEDNLNHMKYYKLYYHVER